MKSFDPVTFGIVMGRLVGEYRGSFAWMAPIPHIATLILLFLVIRYGHKARRAFAVYFVVNYVWVVVFQGVWFSWQVFQRLGVAGLCVYGATPVLLLVILIQWIRELARPRNEIDLRAASWWRFLVAVPMFVWAFWYPPYEWGVRLVFDPGELLFGAYGLMGCPTTMVPLSILFLSYPRVNKPLFHALTVYAVCVGAAMVALKYVPDIPFFVLGIASLGLIIADTVRSRLRLPTRQRSSPSP